MVEDRLEASIETSITMAWLFLWSFGVICQGRRGEQEIESLYISVVMVSGSFLSHWFCFSGYHRVLCCLLCGHRGMWWHCGNTVDISMDSGDLKVAERLRPGTTNRSKQVSQLSARWTLQRSWSVLLLSQSLKHSMVPHFNQHLVPKEHAEIRSVVSRILLFRHRIRVQLRHVWVEGNAKHKEN